MSAMCGQLLLKTSVNSHGSSKWDFKTLWVNELPKKSSVLCLISLKSCGSSAEPLGGINLSCSEGEGSFPWSYCGVTGGVQRALYLVAIWTSDWTEGPLQVCGTGRFLPSIRNLVFIGALWGSQALGAAGWAVDVSQDVGKEHSDLRLAPVLQWDLGLSASPCSLCQALFWLWVWGFFFELTDGRGVWEIPFVLQKSCLEKTSCVLLVQSWFYMN